MPNNLPTSINYTNRDYHSLRDDLILRVKRRLSDAGKNWAATDPADFGVAMLEAFAHVGDLTSYYIDRMANESYLATATQRQSIIDIAESYNYIASGYTQANVSVSLTNPTGSDIVVPQGVQYYIDVALDLQNSTSITRLYFTNELDVTVPANSGTTSTFSHGKSVIFEPGNKGSDDGTGLDGELLAYSDGSDSQEYYLSSNNVADGTVSIYVKNGDTWAIWDQVRHLTDWGPTDTVYTLSVDANNYVKVTFGDGISGAVPTIGEPIKAVYTIGGGVIGNIGARSAGWYLNFVPAGYDKPTINNVAVVSNDASGGSDPEENDSIRANAPKVLQALTRAVSLDDYANLAIAVNGVGKAAAYAESPSLVNLYIGPSVSSTSEDYYPGMSGTSTASGLTVTSSWLSLKDSVEESLQNKGQIGTSVVVLPPSYQDVFIEVHYKATTSSTNSGASFSDANIIAAIKYAVVYGYGYNYIPFNTVIFPSNIEGVLSTINGISAVKITGIGTSASPSTRDPLLTSEGRLYVFKESNLVIFPMAALSGLTANHGTFSPVFDPTILNYTLNGVSTSTITVTPTGISDVGTIKVNETTVTSGSASPSISTPSGVTTTIKIVTTSIDGSTTRTYIIRVPR
jgi:hypothetical protein